jgi:ATP-dependent Clp protease ATP-binding subunit ClpC
MSQGYNFTQNVRRVLALAREHANALRHEYVGTEHLLLGLLEDDGVAGAVIQRIGADRDRISQLVLTTVQRGRTESNRPDLPYTSRAKKSLELSMSEARDMGHNYVGCEHLLLGLLVEGKGIAAQALNSVGVTLDGARTETRRALDITPVEQRGDTMPSRRGPPVPRGQPTEVIVVLRYANGDSQGHSFKSVQEAIQYIGESDAEPA